MENFNESANCPNTDDLRSNVPSCYDKDGQLKEKFGILSQLAAMLRGKEVPKRQSHGWLKFGLIAVLLILAGGGIYYLGMQNGQNAGIEQAQVEKLVEERIATELAKAEEARRATEQKTETGRAADEAAIIDQAQVDKLVDEKIEAKLAEAEEARRAAEQKAAEQKAAEQANAEAVRQEAADDIMFDLDLSKGMIWPDACFKHYKLAKARKTLEKAKAAGTDSQLYQEAEQELKRLLNKTSDEWQGRGILTGFVILAAIFLLVCFVIHWICDDPRKKKYFDKDDVICWQTELVTFGVLFVISVVGATFILW